MTIATSEAPPPASPRRLSRRAVALIAGGAVLVLILAAGGVATALSVQRNAAADALTTAIAALDDAKRQERLAGTAATAALDGALQLSRSTTALHAALPSLADADSLEALQAALDDLTAELAANGIDAADEDARSGYIDLIGADVVAPIVDESADTAGLEAAAAETVAIAAPVVEHTDELRAAVDSLEATVQATLGAVVEVAATTKDVVTATLAANPLASEVTRTALTDAQAAFEDAPAEPDAVALGTAYVKATKAVTDSQAAAAAAQANNSPEYVDPSTGQSVPNPQYNPSLPDSGGGGGGGGGGGDGGGGDGGGTPPVHPRADYCASTGYANNQLCLDAVPATFSTNGSYIPWGSCNAIYYSSHTPGWGGNSNAGYGFPWSATVDGPTVTYYACA